MFWKELCLELQTGFVDAQNVQLDTKKHSGMTMLVIVLQWCIPSFFGQTDTYFEPTKLLPWVVLSRKSFNICTAWCSKNILSWPCLLLVFFVNYFPHGSFLKNSYIHKQVLHGYKPVRAAKRSESWKDVASSTEGITQSNVNYLHHIITWSRFIKKSSRKSKDFHDLLHIQPSTTVVDPHHLKVKEDISPKITAYLSAFKKSAQFISWFLRCRRF